MTLVHGQAVRTFAASATAGYTPPANPYVPLSLEAVTHATYARGIAAAQLVRAGLVEIPEASRKTVLESNLEAVRKLAELGNAREAGPRERLLLACTALSATSRSVATARAEAGGDFAQRLDETDAMLKNVARGLLVVGRERGVQFTDSAVTRTLDDSGLPQIALSAARTLAERGRFLLERNGAFEGDPLKASEMRRQIQETSLRPSPEAARTLTGILRQTAGQLATLAGRKAEVLPMVRSYVKECAAVVPWLAGPRSTERMATAGQAR